MVIVAPGGRSIQKLWSLPPSEYVGLQTWVSSPCVEVDEVYGLEILSRLMIADDGGRRPGVGDGVVVLLRMVAVAPMLDEAI